MTTPVAIIGMGLSPRDLTARHLELIGRADVLVGGRRHLAFFQDHPAEKRIIDKDLAGLTHYLKQRMRTAAIVVLASGDPLFYGIGTTLIQSLGAENVQVFPNISTLAAAFARIKQPWQDAKVVHLHGGGDAQHLLAEVRQEAKVAVYTDTHHDPARLARLLLENHLSEVKICVLEQLGSDKERIQWISPAQAAGEHFSEPNLMIILNPSPGDEPQEKLSIGMPEDRYEHENGLITKAEIRAVTLSKLRLLPGQILWDLGAGCGSVSIEAALFIGSGRIFAVEKDPRRAAQIASNCRRFGTSQVEVRCQVLPRGLETLPAPDRIFIGGGGRHLSQIIRKAAEFLKPDGMMVINTVLLGALQAALATLEELRFHSQWVQVQINQSRPMPWSERLEARNPVWIISAGRTGK
jgi:precorrin-6B C5,15-methyltransferase / cobalt-precorrin-6B C5,C15-methyltransferase